MATSVGSSYVDFQLDIAPLDRSMALAEQRLRKFESLLDKLSTRKIALPVVNTPQLPTLPQGPTSALPKLPTAPNPNTPTGGDRQILALAAAQARAAQAAGDHAKAEQILQGALAKVDNSTVAAINTQTRLLNVQNRLSNSKGPVVLPRTIDGLSGSAAKAVDTMKLLGGAIVAVGAVKGLADQAVQFRDIALNTQRADNSLRILAGSTALYQEALAAARTQQSLFGGSLQENIEGLTGLVTVSRSAGVSLQSLIDVSQQLSIKDPAQGVTGARIAIQEALSGDPVSLARRYEIPRKALAAIRDEATTGAQKLQIISQYLTDVGISASAAADSIPEATRELNAMNAELDNTKIALGNIIAEGFRPFVREATDAFKGIATNINNLSTFDTKARQLNETLLASSGSYQQYASSIGSASNQMWQATGKVLPQLTQGQFLVARGFIEIGLSAQDAYAKVAPFATALEQVRQSGVRLLEGGLPTDAIQSMTDRLNALVLAGGQTSAATSAMIERFLAHKISADQLAAGLTALEGSQQANKRATEEEIIASQRMGSALDATKTGVDEETKAIADSILKKQDAAEKTERLGTAEAFIADIGEQVRDGLITAADGARILAEKFGFAADEADRLTNAAAQAAKATAAQEARGSFLSNLLKFGGQAVAQAKEQVAVQVALHDRILRTGTAQEKLAQAQEDYNRVVAKYGKGSSQAIEAETKLIEARQAAAAEAKKGQKGSTSTANKGLTNLAKDDIALQESLEEQLAAVNRQLEAGNLTQHQRNQLTLRQRELEDQILEAKRAQADAARDAALASVQDAQKRLLEAREIRGLENQAKNDKASAEERQAAALRLQEIALQQQQRQADIAKKLDEAGLTQPPAQQVPQLPEPQPQPQIPPQLPPPPQLPTPPQFVVPPNVLATPPVSVTVNLTFNGAAPQLTNSTVIGADSDVLNVLLNGARASNQMGSF